ncbi:MAG: M56 family metallopeptidase [Acidobacteria bacterium]|nr:M56 family metallopeptidase [Acidobacteriota bacterium]
MTLPLWLSNLVAYSLQIAILTAAGTLLAYLFRLRMPRVILIYWQVLLLACLLLPLLQRWEHPVFSTAVSAQMSTDMEPAISDIAVPIRLEPPVRIPWEILGLILAAGVFARLAWLMIGFFRLQHFRHKAHMFLEEQDVVRDVRWRTGVRVSLFLSGKIDTPVTFGIRPPVIILPFSFKDLSEPCRRAVLCHEFLHVRRYDWILIVMEEVVRSLFWFHPAIWWLLSRIHLSREQAVDYEVVQLTGSKQPYLDSLLEFARAQGSARAVPAPLFLKERHLVQRVALLIKEASMSRSRMVFSMIGISILLMGTVYFSSGWFPLTGAPVFAQEQDGNTEVRMPQREPIRVGGNVAESRLIRRIEPVYPALALRTRVQGAVILTVWINEEGLVYETEVRSGHPLLQQAAVDAVRKWHYSPTLLNGEPVPVIATVTVVFRLDGGGAVVQQGGAQVTVVAEAGGEGASAAVRSPGIMAGQSAHPDVKAPRRTAFRVNGDVQESKLINRVTPIYPEEAKRESLEGTVRLEVTINEEGFVSGIIAAPGTYEILEDAAIAAVKQWRYSPTLLNGEPVPVAAGVTVVFKLRDFNDIVVSMDESGVLSGDLSALEQGAGTVDIRIAQSTPFRAVESAVRQLTQKGVQKIKLSQPFVFYQGQVFYTGKIDNVPQISSPDSEANREMARMFRIAKESGQLEKGKPYRLGYRIYQNEAGDVVGLQHLAGPRIPAIEEELMRNRRPPAILGPDAVPYMAPFYIYCIG